MLKQYSIFFFLAVLALISCNGESTDTVDPDPITMTCAITAPSNGAGFVIGENVVFSVVATDADSSLKSIELFIDGKSMHTTADLQFDFDWSTVEALGGTHTISAVAEDNKGRKISSGVSIRVVSDQAPIKYTKNVVNTYPHNPAAFTQGLVYEDGVLFEGTGLNGQSALRKVELATGKSLQEVPLAQEYFGEGITIFNNKIYQLTYTTNIGFIYDKSTFEKIGEFNYSGEGWGLTHDSTHLIMSDGSSTIRFIDPETFNEVRRIVAFDNFGHVTKLNELEYINGEIYANIWEKEEIVKIDPATGKVLGVIDMSKMLAPSDIHSRLDVLNGIAYDRDKNLLLVTGKNWPKLFAIQLQPQ